MQWGLELTGRELGTLGDGEGLQNAFSNQPGTVVPPLEAMGPVFRRGIHPQDLKKQHIVPLFKKRDGSKAENYRPVALTSHTTKTFERSGKADGCASDSKCRRQIQSIISLLALHFLLRFILAAVPPSV